MSEQPKNVVIVGAGLAGDRCAFTLREEGYDGSITLVGEEIHRPYDRPPLSKQVLKTVGEENAIFYRSFAEYSESKIDLLLGRRATNIDLASRRVELSGASGIAFDRLVLATGSKLRTLATLPAGAPGVYYLREMADALALRDALVAGGRVVVIGGGVIGLEAAASARALGLDVTVVEAAPRLMSRASGDIISHFLQTVHDRAGVRILCGRKIASVHRDGSAWQFSLDDGTDLAGEIVVVGIGVVAENSLAQTAGLTTGPQGIVVDGQGRTSNDVIYAVGEGAFHLNAFSGQYERQENWAHAAAHGDFVGRSILGAGDAYAEIPSVWTDQHDISLKTVGRPTAQTDIVRGDPQSGRFVVFHLEGGKLVGACGVNATRELRGAKALIKSGKPVAPALLADTSVDVAQCLA